MPVATYPGTVTPLRGLGSFAESERDVFFGRDRERDELARLVTSDGYRAGLLYGEAGVGKTSLLQAGLQPDLRDHGVVALFCEDNTQPLASLAQTLSRTSGQPPTEGETPTSFLARVIGEAAQMYLFIFDDVDLAMTTDERVSAEVAELFTRVASRSAGRARFLFCCCSKRVHSYGALEQRTGSLFPPSSRYELSRMQPEEAVMVLDRTIALAGISCQDDVGAAVVENLSHAGPILPSDLQIAALALKEQAIISPAQLAQLGGYPELERCWIVNACSATGNERSAMRLLAGLASDVSGMTHSADWVAAQASIEPSFAREALTVLQSRGLVRATAVYGTEELYYSLSHEILQPRIREIAAPAKLSARRAFELLGSKAAQNKRLTPGEYLALRREGIVPATQQEQAVIDRTLRLGKLALAAIAALPILIVILAYLSLSGRYYLDTASGAQGVETIVVRAGKPSWFSWLPKSPAFGSIVADSGLSKRMVSEDLWLRAGRHEATGELSGAAYAEQAHDGLRPRLAHLVDYAVSAEGAALDALQKTVTDSDDFAQLLRMLQPIAQGTPEEVLLIETALKDPSAAVQTEALMVAAASARRTKGSYAAPLARALSSADSERRRLSFSVVRTLEAQIADPLYQAALALEPEPTARRELLALLSGSADSATASAASATTVLLGESVSKATREKARAMLERAFESDPEAASADAAKLVASASGASEDRMLAMSLLLDFAPESSYSALKPAIDAAGKSQDINVRAAALPLYAHIDSQKAAGDLARLLDKDLPSEMEVAAATAWGEIARSDRDNRAAAQVALEKMLNSRDRSVRAAAARAYGYLGRASQDELSKMVKKEFIDVAEGAAYGLANSTEVGGSTRNAIAGIRQMWKRKGRLRRIATSVYARLARTKPGQAYFYVSAAARVKDDDSLHPIGMRGLCNALKAGNPKAGRDLARAASSTQVEVRRIAIQCIVDYRKNPKISARIAAAMVDDSNGDIRAEVARVLAGLAAQGQSKKLVGDALSTLIRDDNRGVRVVAIRALASLEDGAPEAAIEALPTAFDRADEAEKLVMLDVGATIGATDLVQLGIADPSPLVRVAALDTAISTSTDVSAILNSALTDPDPGVRRAALQRLSKGKHSMQASDVAQGLALAIRDSDPTISDLAMMANARLGDPEQASARLRIALQKRSEILRAKAAAACHGLVSHAPKRAIELLEPLLSDPSHDVRVAMLRPLASAYASSMDAEQLGELMTSSETHASRRLTAAAALFVLAESEREVATTELQQVVNNGPAFARHDAALTLGLLASSADGLTFLGMLVP